MLVKAAAGSPKNMVPVREIATSNDPAGEEVSWASACSSRALAMPSLRREVAANAIIWPDRSTPSPAVGGSPSGIAADLPGPAADVEHALRARWTQWPRADVVGGDAPVEPPGVFGPVGALVPVPRPGLFGVGRVYVQ